MKTVKLKDFKGDWFDVIENDDDKDYGYSEIYIVQRIQRNWTSRLRVRFISIGLIF